MRCALDPDERHSARVLPDLRRRPVSRRNDRRGPPPCIRTSQLVGRRRVEIHDEQVLLERRAAGEDRSIRSDDEAVTVEYELVLPADGVAERQEATLVAAASRKQLLPLPALALVIRRGRKIEDYLRAALQDGPFRRTARQPDVLADRDAQALAVEFDDDRLVSGREVAPLVEDGVVGQVVLAVHGRYPPVGQHRRAVVQRGARGLDGGRHGPRALEARRAGHGRHVVRHSDAGHDAGHPGCHLTECRRCVPHEARLEQEILRRVAGDGQLGEQDDVGLPLPRLADSCLKNRDVAGEIADDQIQLAESDAERAGHR